MWSPVASAPFERDLEVAVIDGNGAHVIVFPCRRVLGGWVKAASGQRLVFSPTHWRPWQQDPIAAAATASPSRSPPQVGDCP